MQLFATVEEARQQAKRRLPRVAFDFIDGGADDEVTLRRNRSAFQQVALRPRHLIDCLERDQTLTVLGNPVSSPVLIGPTGLARMAGRAGDLAAARAASRKGSIFVISTMSSHSLEQVAEAGSCPLWFQVYLWRQRDVIDGLVERARKLGYQALVVTLDVPVHGKRERDVRNGFTLPPRLRIRTAADMLRHPRWLLGISPPITFANFVEAGYASPSTTAAHGKWINDVLCNPGATYDDLKRLREVWPGALLVKGTLTGEDAERLVAAGVNGIIVSNHGGRQLDTCVSTLEALPEVVEATAGRAEVFLDGGVRRGTDVVKALAFGARACFIGRPWLWGLAAAGEVGVDRILDVFAEEIDRTLALTGRRTLADVDVSIVSSPPGFPVPHSADVL